MNEKKKEPELIIKCENLMKTYGEGGTFVNAVDRVNLSLYAGEFTAIVGKSGSGKSTLLHLLGGLDMPSGGDVYVYDTVTEEENAETKPPVMLYSLTRSALARYRGENFGFVFQNYALMPVLTAWENVMLPSVYNNTKFDEAYAALLFERLGIKDRIHHLPSEMSGGEQQRVGIIRAMISHPRILFADEPTGNLDSANGEEIMRVLMSLRDEENCTIILVTHDEKIAASADRVVTMKDGMIVKSEKLK